MIIKSINDLSEIITQKTSQKLLVKGISGLEMISHVLSIQAAVTKYLRLGGL